MATLRRNEFASAGIGAAAGWLFAPQIKENFNVGEDLDETELRLTCAAAGLVLGLVLSQAL